jgi:hypothetical protein
VSWCLPFPTKFPSAGAGPKLSRILATTHRTQIRQALGFRECTVADAEVLIGWLVDHVTQVERSAERVREHLLAECRRRRLEPPTAERIDRIVRSALSRGEDVLFARVASRLPGPVRAKLLALVERAGEGDGDFNSTAILASIRSDPGNVSLNTMLTEIAKLEAVRAVGVPADMFADVAPKIIIGWRGRAAVESPSHLRVHPLQVKLTLIAAMLHCRCRETTDTLVELLNSTVHRINARAEVRVTNELVKDSSELLARRICCSASPRRRWTRGTSWCATPCFRWRRRLCYGI